jgi:hypothetical protein
MNVALHNYSPIKPCVLITLLQQANILGKFKLQTKMTLKNENGRKLVCSTTSEPYIYYSPRDALFLGKSRAA